MAATTENVNMLTKLAYGTGHVLNDMCSSMYVTYGLLFWHSVLHLSTTMAAQLVLIGQFTDGIGGVLVGLLSDKDKDFWMYVHYGKRKVVQIALVYLFKISNLFFLS